MSEYTDKINRWQKYYSHPDNQFIEFDEYLEMKRKKVKGMKKISVKDWLIFGLMTFLLSGHLVVHYFKCMVD